MSLTAKKGKTTHKNGMGFVQLKTKGMDALNPVIKAAEELRRKKLIQSLQTEYEKSASSKRGRRG